MKIPSHALSTLPRVHRTVLPQLPAARHLSYLLGGMLAAAFLSDAPAAVSTFNRNLGDQWSVGTNWSAGTIPDFTTDARSVTPSYSDSAINLTNGVPDTVKPVAFPGDKMLTVHDVTIVPLSNGPAPRYQDLNLTWSTPNTNLALYVSGTMTGRSTFTIQGVENSATARVSFIDGGSAGSMSYYVMAGGLLRIGDEKATVGNFSPGTGGSAYIRVLSGGFVQVVSSGSTLESAFVDARGTGAIYLFNGGKGGNADISLADTATFDQVGTTATEITAGSITGTGGTFYIGNAAFTVGATNNSTTFGGLIKDGGQAGAVGQTGASLIKTGTGILKLTGSLKTGNGCYSGPTVVNTGGLEVDGDLTSTSGITVKSGRLSGAGTVAKVTVEASGEIAPGEQTTGSVDTLTVAGSLDAGGNYLVDVTPAGADLITVSGVATLTGGTITLQPAAGAYGTMKIKLLHADGGIADQFASVSLGAYGSATPKLIYEANDVYLQLTGSGGTPAKNATLTPFKKKGITHSSKYKLRGSQNGSVEFVYYKVGKKGKFRKVKVSPGTTWSIKVKRLKPGKNVVRFYGVAPSISSTTPITRIVVTRK